MNAASKITDLTAGRSFSFATRNEAVAVQYLTFNVASEQYGVDILKVREIHSWAVVVTQLPNAPAFLRGVMNLHGAIVPVIDLRLRFGLEAMKRTKATVMIVVTVRGTGGNRDVGVVVDGVWGVLNVDRSDIQPAPDFETVIGAEFVNGLVTVETDRVTLLNVDRLVDIDELFALAATLSQMVA